MLPSIDQLGRLIGVMFLLPIRNISDGPRGRGENGDSMGVHMGYIFVL